MFGQLFDKMIISWGTFLFLVIYLVTNLSRIALIYLNLLVVYYKLMLSDVYLVKVSLTVATPVSFLTLPALLISKETSIVLPWIWGEILGAQSVLPALTAVWSKILVWILLAFFFFNVPSTTTWLTTFRLSRQYFLMLL